MLCGQEELAQHVTHAADGKPSVVRDRASCNALAHLMAGCLQARARSAAVRAAVAWFGRQSQVGRWWVVVVVAGRARGGPRVYVLRSMV